MDINGVIGVDVGKQWLDIACGATAVERCPNEPAAIGRFVSELSARDVVVFEPCGGYERALQAALAQANVPWALVHSAQVKAFREFQGIKAKSDAIDARLLQAFGRDRLNAGQLRLGYLEDVVLKTLTARRRQLRRALHGEQCRLASAASMPVRASIERMVAMIENELAAIDGEFAAHIAQDPLLALKHRVMCEQIGIADSSARSLLAEVPELGTLGRKPITALGGLASRVHKSGRTDLRRGVVPGRNMVKVILFNPARTAMRWDPQMKAFADRLRARGKHGKVIMVAVMRKLLVQLNARVRDALRAHAAAQSAALRQSEPSMTAKPDAARSSVIEIRG